MESSTPQTVFYTNQLSNSIISNQRVNFSDLSPTYYLSVNLSTWICWFLWTTRNLLVFENRRVSATVIVSNALSSAREWLSAQHTALVPHHVRLTPPE
ncbi:hypothetical protein Bca4012_013740 [Brassica carinata]